MDDLGAEEKLCSSAVGARRMLMYGRLREPIARGEVTLTFRRWKRPQVVAGRRYRTAAGRIEVDAIEVVDDAKITNAAARRAGFASRAELLADLRGDSALPLYRVRFHAVVEPDERDVLAADAALDGSDLDSLSQRLARLDRASKTGPWTLVILELIAAQPEVRAADLAQQLGRETQPFKLDVRKLKNLGLTISLERGYRLSPRGAAYLEATRHAS